MWCAQVPLTPVFPRQFTAQQVHSPLHLQEEVLPTKAAKTVSMQDPTQNQEQIKLRERKKISEKNKSSIERIGQHQVKDLIDKLKE